MGDLYNRLLSLCNQKGVTGAQMCRDCGLSKSLMSDLKYGRRDTISTETAAKLAEYFSVTVDEILFGIKKEQSTETDELLNELNLLFQKQSDDIKREALNYLRYLVDKKEIL